MMNYPTPAEPDAWTKEEGQDYEAYLDELDRQELAQRGEEYDAYLDAEFQHQFDDAL